MKTPEQERDNEDEAKAIAKILWTMVVLWLGGITGGIIALILLV